MPFDEYKNDTFSNNVYVYGGSMVNGVIRLNNPCPEFTGESFLNFIESCKVKLDLNISDVIIKLLLIRKYFNTYIKK